MAQFLDYGVQQENNVIQSELPVARSPQPSSSSSDSGLAVVGGVGLFVVLVGLVVVRQWWRSPDADQPQLSPSALRFSQGMQWVAYGKSLERQKDYAGAIAVYDQGLAQHPNDFRLWHERGLAFAKAGQFEAALTSFDRAQALRPKNADLAHERGDTLLELQQYELAIASFDLCLKFQPDNAHILADKGYALVQLGRYEAALEVLDPILRAERRDRAALYHAYTSAIEALRQLQRGQAALKLAQQARDRLRDNEYFQQKIEQLQQALTAQQMPEAHS